MPMSEQELTDENLKLSRWNRGLSGKVWHLEKEVAQLRGALEVLFWAQDSPDIAEVVDAMTFGSVVHGHVVFTTPRLKEAARQVLIPLAAHPHLSDAARGIIATLIADSQPQ